jgi:phage tail sheath protein FI
MAEYLSPGVYVEEVPSTIKPIAGVSTSTAAFVGIISGPVDIPEENPFYDPTGKSADEKSKQSFRTWTFPVPDADYIAKKTAFEKLTEPDSKPARPASPKAGAPPLSVADFKAFREAQTEYAAASARKAAGQLAEEGVPVLCTTFNDFTKSFGGFSTNKEQNILAQGVYGFFHNGGTRCYVMRYSTIDGLQDPIKGLTPFEAIDEISMVAAPGIVDQVVQSSIVDHCTNMSDRFAILDPPEQTNVLTEEAIKVVGNTDYGALYFPRIKVFDIASKLKKINTLTGDESDDGEIFIGPSGHMAGIYARVDHERGVHKAPANEVVRGALATEVAISKALQDGLNPGGVNCIRNINDNITVWGARTIGGDFNTDLKYINVRRTLLFLRKSIDHGTQWVVFEPNDRTLWAKIVRNVGAFLTTVWRDGALFGSTPQEAFYVRCDDETNPPEERDLGRVTTEIGVAIVRPAEFVIFRIEQWSGPQGS